MNVLLESVYSRYIDRRIHETNLWIQRCLQMLANPGGVRLIPSCEHVVKRFGVVRHGDRLLLTYGPFVLDTMRRLRDVVLLARSHARGLREALEPGHSLCVREARRAGGVRFLG
jgi:hypothetical protein